MSWQVGKFMREDYSVEKGDGCSVSEFWDRFEEARIRAGRIPLRTLCWNTSVSYQTIVNQRCAKRYMAIPDMIKMSKELGCSIDWLLTGKTGSEVGRKSELIERIKNFDAREIETLAYLIGKH